MWQLFFRLESPLEIQQESQHQEKGCLMVMAEPLDLGHGKNNYYKNSPKQSTFTQQCRDEISMPCWVEMFSWVCSAGSAPHQDASNSVVVILMEDWREAPTKVFSLNCIAIKSKMQRASSCACTYCPCLLSPRIPPP